MADESALDNYSTLWIYRLCHTDCNVLLELILVYFSVTILLHWLEQ